MCKKIQTLHFITHGSPEEQIRQAEEACVAGIQWIQFRLKNTSETILLQTAQAIKQICKTHNVTFIVNDYLDIAVKTDADGVHLGKEDCSVTLARTKLGPDKIIGGTANTLEDIKKLALEGIDYIGLGPYRFSNTKEKLSPILGIKGYQSILQAMKQGNISIPVIAIGGIQKEDSEALFRTGIHGVAVSSALISSPQKKEVIQSFHSSFNR